MKTIKFSGGYPKLQGLKKAQLVNVFVQDKKDMPDAFLEYDTKKEDGTYYKLIPNKYLVLLFTATETKRETGTPIQFYRAFTTVRRLTERKEKYYKKMIGQVFRIDRGIK